MNSPLRTAMMAAAVALAASIPHARAARISLSSGSKQTWFGGRADHGMMPIPHHVFAGGTIAIRSHLETQEGRLGLRVALTLDGAGGNRYDAGSVRLTSEPTQMRILGMRRDTFSLAPYVKTGVVSLSMTRPSTVTMIVTSPGGCLNRVCTPPTYTTSWRATPGVTLATGYVFAGLRAHSHMTRRLTLFAHAAVGTSLGGSITGMDQTIFNFSQSEYVYPQSIPKGVGVDYGYGMRYLIAPRTRVSVGYSELFLPIRGAYLDQGGWMVGASYSFR